MRITFHGAARSVTGANHLFEVGDTKILVDCGLSQEGSMCDPINVNTFPYDPKMIDVLCISHAHLDHVGRIPKLVKEGFRGQIIATPPTIDLAKLSFDDSLHIFEHEEKVDCPPTFSEEDVAQTMKLFRSTKYGETVTIKDVTITPRDAGHILGSSMFEMIAEGKRIVFTGDIGNPPTPLLSNPHLFDAADVVVIESAYGDRNHDDRAERKLRLERVIEDVVARGGVLMVPSFAIERTQELLYELNDLVEHRRIPQIPIFIDSPLAIQATEIYRKHQSFFNIKTQDVIRSGDQIFRFPRLKFTRTRDESKSINDVPAPKMIIAGSGNSMGGRILHHEMRYLPDPKSALLVVGYQPQRSRGRALVDGAKTIHIFGKRVPVRAHIESMYGYSAHADQEALFGFIAHMQKRPEKVFAVQGEETAALALVTKIRDSLGIHAYAPTLGETFEI